jgi:hypothetical protein
MTNTIRETEREGDLLAVGTDIISVSDILEEVSDVPHLCICGIIEE